MARIHFIPNSMWSTITACSSDADGMATYDLKEVTCPECLKALELNKNIA